MNDIEINFLAIMAIVVMLLLDPVLKRKISKWF